ncbi:flagellar biosynthetic protein FliO [Phreatobacter sp.]|uniref:flagellar biosynthetic protein FliO n=1 Tax=Phreatobacter sp. TaxID=1966341 RepID=UPI0022C8EF03|nr:flagellar biosynthetic protein FliO [Phreatobacter sp.]MCZ8314509.1 flagellar biosynthetic protein FliO [Phreatobacter sp.]
MNYISNLLGPNAPLAATFIVAFAAVLVLIGLTAWIFRIVRGRGLGIGSGGRGRQPRLAVLDYADVDQRRKLVLIRRDNVEHLLLLGGPTDVVVETSIVRGAPVQAAALREVAAAQAPVYVEPDPPMPAQRASLREAARQAAGELPAPAPAMRPETSLRMPEPARPAPQPAPQQTLRPEPTRAPPPPPPVARPEPPRPDIARPEVARPEVPKITPVVTQPVRPATPTPPPARPASPASAGAAVPDDVAARLEAALKKPIGAAPAAVAPAPVRPATPPAPAPRPAMTQAPATAPKSLSPDEKSVFDSLEEEMAALLGRGPTPPKG